MASINGGWFHSRSSSNLEELLTVRTLVLESQKPEYIGFGCSGGRQRNQKMYKFTEVANIHPSLQRKKATTSIFRGNFLCNVRNNVPEVILT